MNTNYTVWDVALIKLGVLAAAFFLISVWSGLANWVIGTNWIWFLIATVILMIKPIISTLKN